MPVRRVIVGALTERIVGTHVWNGLIGEPVSIPREEWDRAKEAADELFEQIVGRVDWRRIYIEASARHFQVHDGDGYNPCGKCIQQALLYDERGLGLSALHPWEEQPTVPERDVHPDWPAEIAELVQWRRSGVVRE